MYGLTVNRIMSLSGYLLIINKMYLQRSTHLDAAYIKALTYPMNSKVRAIKTFVLAQSDKFLIVQMEKYTGAETMQGRKLFKGRNYLQEYGI